MSHIATCGFSPASRELHKNGPAARAPARRNLRSSSHAGKTAGSFQKDAPVAPLGLPEFGPQSSFKVFVLYIPATLQICLACGRVAARVQGFYPPLPLHWTPATSAPNIFAINGSGSCFKRI